jgi:hypothetical protein
MGMPSSPCVVAGAATICREAGMGTVFTLAPDAVEVPGDECPINAVIMTTITTITARPPP